MHHRQFVRPPASGPAGYLGPAPHRGEFISHKQELPDVKSRFSAEEYYHIGDTELDRQFALEAGFHFLWMDDGIAEPWINGKADKD